MSVLCEICERNINGDDSSDNDIYSSDDHDIICSQCHSSHCPCDGCGDMHNSDDLFTNGRDEICSDCRRNSCSCDNCGMRLTGRYNEYYCDFNNESYCRNCLDDSEAYECESCGHEQELEVPLNADFFWPDA